MEKFSFCKSNQE